MPKNQTSDCSCQKNIEKIYLSPQKQIWTGQKNNKARVESLVIDNQGKICFCGNIEECRVRFPRAFLEKAHTIEGSIVAGGVDSHNHFWYALLQKIPSVAHIKNAKQLQIFIKEQTDLCTNEILFLRDADSTHLFSSSLLNTISKPLVIFHRSYHKAYINLAASKLPQLTKIPSCDFINHWQIKNSVIHLLRSEMFTCEYILNAFSSFAFSLLQQGIVCVHDLFVYDVNFVNALQKVPIKNYLYAPRYALQNNKHMISHFVGVKSFMDGAIGTQTAKFYKNYNSSTSSGIFYITEKELLADIDFAVEHNLQTACHGIGTQGIATIIDTYEKRKNHIIKPRIEHFQCPQLQDINRLQNLNIAVCPQPNFSQDSYDYEQPLGKRAKTINPFRKLINNNVKFATGSDGMPSGLRECLLWSIMPRHEEQQMTLEEAVHYSTIASADLISTQVGIVKGNDANFVYFAKPLDELYSYSSPRITSNWQLLREELDELFPITAVYLCGQNVG
ncbi:amidohydrolase family protein [Candidatus Uabimicrobium sp. HlEnr_7]|uniref:amidohydrolase family protein n=1 Tax=Candidatus Uabimicrobium helgolandensis TaxID=3095367 RepID=UPI0035591BF5